MRRLLPAPVRMLALAAAAAGTCTLAVSARAADLTIAVSNIESPTGVLYWNLFDSAAAYDDDGAPVIGARARVDGDALTVTVHDLPDGRYAVKLYHDANGNGQLDTNMVGLPTEGYGFSNNAGAMGPARFDEAAVQVSGDAVIDVRVR